MLVKPPIQPLAKKVGLWYYLRMRVKEAAIERARERYDELVRRRGAEVVAMREAGLTFAELALHFGVTRARVHQIYRQHRISLALPGNNGGQEPI